MALLKRVKASTLMETLVATVLIVVIFMVSSMLMNNMVSGKIKQNTEIAQEQLNALEYQFKNNGLALPYYEDFESWEIMVAREKTENTFIVIIEAKNPYTNKVVTNYINDH